MSVPGPMKYGFSMDCFTGACLCSVVWREYGDGAERRQGPVCGEE